MGMNQREDHSTEESEQLLSRLRKALSSEPKLENKQILRSLKNYTKIKGIFGT